MRGSPRASAALRHLIGVQLDRAIRGSNPWGPEGAAGQRVLLGKAALDILIGRRRDVSGRIGRRRRRIGGGAGRRCRGRAHHGTNRDPRGDTTPVWSAVIIAVAAAATADIHIPICVHVDIAVRTDVPGLSVRYIPMEVIAVETAAVSSARPAARTLSAAATRPVLYEDQCTIAGANSSSDLACDVLRPYCDHQRCCGAARQCHSGRQREGDCSIHVSGPNTWLEAP